MRDDVPAALPLIAYVAGLAGARTLVNATASAWSLLVCALLLCMIARRRAALLTSLCALGLLIGTHHDNARRGEVEHVRGLDSEVFATVEGPIDRDWMRRGSANVLIVSRFSLNGVPVDSPLRIYVRFDPRAIEMNEVVRAEGFIRQDERGRFTMSIKSPRLVSYGGTLSPFNPERWNRAVTNRVRRFAGRYPVEVALIEALALGRGESLSNETRENFRRGGTYHLLVFSGLQIAFAAAIIAALLRFLDAPRLSDWSLLLFSIIAPFFIGPTASVARASLGIALYALSRIAKRPTSLANLWCVAALLRLMAVPADLTDVAFQLTYAGAGALIFIGKPLARTPLRWLAYALAAEVAITPLTLYHFHQYALGGSLLTIVMTPIVFAMLVLSAAFCAVTAEPFLQAIGFLNKICSLMNDGSAAFSGFAAAPALSALIVGFALAMAALPSWRRRRAVGVGGATLGSIAASGDEVWRAVAIIAALSIPSASTLIIGYRLRSVAHPRVTVLDVGQGDAILARADNRTMLVDAGGRHDDPRFGEATLIPMLVDRGVREIDVALVTHAHPDHCGGMPAVISYLNVGEVWISPRNFRGPCAHQLLEACMKRRVPIHIVRQPFERPLGPLRIHVWPADRGFRKSPENNSSLVVRLDADGRRVLLTGDIEREREMNLEGEDLRADVLKVAHHGSRSSSTPSFLDAVRPRLAVISCGARNLFRHPHPQVLADLKARGINVLRTDRAGTIEIEFMNGHLVTRREIDTISGAP